MSHCQNSDIGERPLKANTDIIPDHEPSSNALQPQI